MPQPMSTPTAAGTIAPTVGITEPTVAPMPQCTSGITATWWWMNGSEATFFNCFSAAPSSVTPRVHALMGAPGLSIMSYPLMADLLLIFPPAQAEGAPHTKNPSRPGREGFLRPPKQALSGRDQPPAPSRARAFAFSPLERSSSRYVAITVGVLEVIGS